MAEAYLAAEFSRQLSAGLVMPMSSLTPTTPAVEDHRSREVANENAQNLKGMMGMVSGLAGVGRKK